MVHSVFSRVFRSRRRQLLAGAGATWLLTLAGAAHAAAKRGNAWLGVALSRGPAGGVVGAGLAARRAGFPDALAFDMGGTSTDVCLLPGGRAARGLYGVSPCT